MRDRDFIRRLIERAKAAKCSALVLTLDLQIIGQRHKDLKNGLSVPPRILLSNVLDILTKPRWGLRMLGAALHHYNFERVERDLIERSLLQSALGQTHGVQVKAASVLGISYRSFRHLMKKYEL